jgi:hypothetical protein
MHRKLSKGKKWRFFLPVIYLVIIAVSCLVIPKFYHLDDPPYLLLRVISITQWITIVILAGGLGYASLRYLPNWLARNEGLLVITIASSLGFGLLATLISFLGYLQILTPVIIQALIIILLVLLPSDCETFLDLVLKLVKDGFRSLPDANITTKLLAIFALILMILTLINTLTPPWDYDGLMYHLLGPSQFLEAGGFFPDFDNWYVNGPFSIEMLFTIGISLGDNVLPKLIHFAFWILLGMASFSIANLWYSREIALLTLALVLGVPAIPIWASFAYIDIAWSTFELLALGCMLTWWKENDQNWLTLAGVFTALMLGTKYLSLFGTGIIGLLFIYTLISEKRKLTGKTIIALGLPILIIALPWYLRNLIWFTNPIYPLIWGGPGWDPVRVNLYNAYLGSFGKGSHLLDFLLLPWNVYAHNELFGAVFNRNDIPHVLFILVPLAPFLRKDRMLRLLILVCLLRVGLWFIGSQQIRFLLPIYPLLALLSAVSIHDLSTGFTRRTSLQLVLPTLSVALIFIPIFYQFQIIRQYRTLDVLTGRTDREDFLENAIGDYAASKFIREELPDTARVLMLGNGRGYYCVPKCLPDPDHFHRALQIADLDPDAPLDGWMREMSATHIQISIEDLDFLLQHDPKDIMQQAFNKILSIPSNDCLEKVFDDQWVEIYEVKCDER